MQKDLKRFELTKSLDFQGLVRKQSKTILFEWFTLELAERLDFKAKTVLFEPSAKYGRSEVSC